MTSSHSGTRKTMTGKPMADAATRFKELRQLYIDHHVEVDQRNYVETGCRDGQMLAHFLADGWSCHGIEMDPELARKASCALQDEDATIYSGDSADLIWHVCRKIQGPAFFFLDAHWWGKFGECAQSDLPLLSELAAIRTRSYADFVVIDDVNLFGLNKEQCEENGVDIGWAGVTRMTIQTALGKSRILAKGVVDDEKPYRMWISLVER